MKQPFEAANENIQSIADRLAINNLLLDFAAAIDNKDINALNDIFTPDATIDYPVSGGGKGSCHQRNELLEQALPHVVSNADVNIDGDTASGRTVCHILRLPIAKVVREICYVDKFLRTEKGWRITERVLHQDRDVFSGSAIRI